MEWRILESTSRGWQVCQSPEQALQSSQPTAGSSQDSTAHIFKAIIVTSHIWGTASSLPVGLVRQVAKSAAHYHTGPASEVAPDPAEVGQQDPDWVARTLTRPLLQGRCQVGGHRAVVLCSGMISLHMLPAWSRAPTRLQAAAPCVQLRLLTDGVAAAVGRPSGRMLSAAS